MTHQHLPHSRRKGVDKVWPSYASAESRLAKIVFREHLKRSIPPMSRRRKYRLCSVFAASRVGRTDHHLPSEYRSVKTGTEESCSTAWVVRSWQAHTSLLVRK